MCSTLQVGRWLGERLKRPYEFKYVAGSSRDVAVRPAWQSAAARCDADLIEAYFGEDSRQTLLRGPAPGASTALDAVEGVRGTGPAHASLVHLMRCTLE